MNKSTIQISRKREKLGRMTTISDLSEDLVREILSRVPFTSLIAVRSTCKMWNALSKNQILGKKATVKPRNQFVEFMVIDSSVYSLRFDLEGIRNEDEEDFIDPSMKQISIPNNHQVEISQVHHCDGLLLCITKDNSRLLVWNPYLGQTKWIRPRNKLHGRDRFALGYDNKRNHKILRFIYDRRHDIDVYDFSSDSWRAHDVDVNLNRDISFDFSGVSLKGNSYFFGQESTTEEEYGELEIEDYLLCFDFTAERFGPRLPLPFDPPYVSYESVALFWVRDEKLAVLYNHEDHSEIIKIWISTKIEPNALSWSAFLTLDISVINGLPDRFLTYFVPENFFIEEGMKVAVLFEVDKYKGKTCFYQMAYIFGDDGYFKSVNIGVVSDPKWTPGKLVCSSYVPSLVQLQF